jgi:hypothetical protein
MGSPILRGLIYQFLTSHNYSCQLTQLKVKVMLWPTLSWPMCLRVKPTSGAQDQIFITVRHLRVISVGRPLTWEDGSVVYNCCWSSPAQSFSGSSPLGLATIFYCLRFETPPTWRARLLYLYPPEQGDQSQSHIATDGQSISKSLRRAPSGDHDQIFITLWQLRSCFCGAPSLTRGRVCLLYMLLGLAR